MVRGEGIFHQTGGTPEAGSHTVVYLHGAGGASSWWVEQMASSGCDAVYAVAVDLPGHGKSQGRAVTSVEEHADWLKSFLDTLAIRQEVVLVGACLGGLIALEFAHRFPDRVLGVVLCGLPGGISISHERLRAAGRGDDLLEYIPLLFASGAGKVLCDRTAKHWLKTRPEVRYADLKACSDYQPHDALRSLTVPVMIALGDGDRYASREEVLRWAFEAEAEIAWIEGAGLLCMLERPETFRDSLCRFLRSLSSPALPHELRYALGGYRRTASR